MQDTPNSHLEVERRDPFLGILGRGLGRREEFAVVNPRRFDSPWPPFGVGRARLKIVRTCNLHDCVGQSASFWLFPSCSRRRQVETCQNPLLWLCISKPVGLTHPPLVLSRGASQMCKRVACLRFRDAAADLQALRVTYQSWALSALRRNQVARGPSLSSPDPPCGAIWAFHFC